METALYKNKKSLFITLSVFVIFAGAFYFSVLGFVKEKDDALLQLGKDLSFEIQKEKRLKSIGRLITNISEERETIDSYFVSPDGVVVFIEELESIAGISGVTLTINTVSVEEGVGASQQETLRVEYETLGAWKNTYHFLSLIEKAPYNIELRRVFLQHLEGPTDSEELISEWKGSFTTTVLKEKSL